MKQIALALTHFNRYDMIMECLSPIVTDPRIGQIVISDDCSNDGSFEKLYALFHVHEKVRLFRNAANVDCYRNKYLAIARVDRNFEHTILLDSDNVMQRDYLDALDALPPLRADTIYCPEFAKPHFDFRAFSGHTITSKNVAAHMPKKSFSTMLNAANYVVPTAAYREVWNQIPADVNPHTADSIYMAYHWLRTGHEMHVVRRMSYFHRVHPGSHYKQNHHKTGRLAQDTEDKLCALR